jgi:hypothetical protein
LLSVTDCSGGGHDDATLKTIQNLSLAVLDFVAYCGANCVGVYEEWIVSEK